MRNQNQKTDISANTKHKNATLSLSELAELEKQQQTELQKETRSFRMNFLTMTMI